MQLIPATCLTPRGRSANPACAAATACKSAHLPALPPRTFGAGLQRSRSWRIITDGAILSPILPARKLGGLESRTFAAGSHGFNKHHTVQLRLVHRGVAVVPLARAVDGLQPLRHAQALPTPPQRSSQRKGPRPTAEPRNRRESSEKRASPAAYATRSQRICDAFELIMPPAGYMSS